MTQFLNIFTEQFLGIPKRHSLNGDQHIDAGQHDHRQQTVAEHRDDGANGNRRCGSHQREQRVEGQTTEHTDAVDVRERHLAALSGRVFSLGTFFRA